jgi:hypothetical protein
VALNPNPSSRSSRRGAPYNEAIDYALGQWDALTLFLTEHRDIGTRIDHYAAGLSPFLELHE